MNQLKNNYMHKKSAIVTAFVTAAITFTCLWFSLGPDHFNRGRNMCEPCGNGCMQIEHRQDCCDDHTKTSQKEVIVIKEVVKKDSVAQ
jgi:hypothetical protein